MADYSEKLDLLKEKMDKKRFKEALAIIDDLSTNYPYNEQIEYEKAFVYATFNNKEGWTTSAGIFKKIANENGFYSDEAKLQFIRIAVLAGLNDPEIVSYANELIDKDYHPRVVYYHLGKYYERCMMYKLAGNLYIESATLGHVQAKERIHKKYFKQSLRVTDYSTLEFDNIKNRLNVALLENDYDEIKKLLIPFEEKMPAYNENIYLLFSAYLYMGNQVSALNIIRTYNSKILGRNLINLTNGDMELYYGDYERALDYYSKVTGNIADFEVYKASEMIAILSDYLNKKELCEETLFSMNEQNESEYLRISDYYFHHGDLEKAIYFYKLTSDKEKKYRYQEYIMLGLLLGFNLKDIGTYETRQIKNYNFKEAVTLIRKNGFNQNINIYNLITYVEKLIKSGKIKCLHNIIDKYVINYENAGISEGLPANYIVVESLPNSHKILNMYPAISDNLFYKNSNNNQSYGLERPVVRERKSQIDKFYEKYGMNR